MIFLQFKYCTITLQILEHLPIDYYQGFRHRWSQSQGIVSFYLLPHSKIQPSGCSQFGARISSENCVLCMYCFLCQDVVCITTAIILLLPKVIGGSWNKQLLHVNDHTVKVCGSPGSSCPSGDLETQFPSTL